MTTTPELTSFILTPATRAALADVLNDDIADRDSITRRGSWSYLDVLTSLSDGTVIADTHELWDVVEYFDLFDSLA